MIIKTISICVFTLLVFASVRANEDNDLSVAETMPKKAIVTGSALKANKNGVVIENGKKFAKGAAAGKEFAVKKAGGFAAGVNGLGAFKKAGKKGGFLAKGGLKKVNSKKMGYDKAFAIGSKQTFGKMATFGKKSKFALGKSKGFATHLNGFKGGVKKSGGFAAGVNVGVKKLAKGTKARFAAGKGGKVGAMANVSKGVALKKAVVAAGKVASNKLATGLKG